MAELRSNMEQAGEDTGTEGMGSCPGCCQRVPLNALSSSVGTRWAARLDLCPHNVQLNDPLARSLLGLWQASGHTLAKFCQLRTALAPGSQLHGLQAT